MSQFSDSVQRVGKMLYQNRSESKKKQEKDQRWSKSQSAIIHAGANLSLKHT